jgi:hypothetical protein
VVQVCKLSQYFSIQTQLLTMYNIMGVLEPITLLVFKLFLHHALFICTVLRAPPHSRDDQSGPSPPTNERPGFIGQAVCRTQKLSGGNSVRKLYM